MYNLDDLITVLTLIIALRITKIHQSLPNRFYTSAGYDMIDIENQRIIYGAAWPVDRVSGYTLPQLKQTLIGARSWW